MNTVNLLDENLLLWNQFREGDADAFGEIMRLHYNDLFSYGSRFTKDAELIKDCIQELFLSLWKNRLTISQTSFVKYYLLTSLRRRLNKAIKKAVRFSIRNELTFQGLFIEDASPENNLVNDEDSKQLTVAVRRVLNDLPKRQQEIIWLRFFMDADADEIAEIMALNKQSVYNLLHKALKKLKDNSLKKGWSMARFSTYLHSFF